MTTSNHGFEARTIGLTTSDLRFHAGDSWIGRVLASLPDWAGDELSSISGQEQMGWTSLGKSRQVGRQQAVPNAKGSGVAAVEVVEPAPCVSAALVMPLGTRECILCLQTLHREALLVIWPSALLHLSITVVPSPG